MSRSAHRTRRGSGPHWGEAADLLWLAAQVAVHTAPVGVTTPPQPPPPPPPKPPPAPDPAPESHQEPDASPAQPDELLISTGELPTPGQAPLPGTWSDSRPAARRAALVQALKPFRVTVPTTHSPANLDEEATAEQAAHDGLWLPVLRPARERLLDLDIVLDDGQCARLHRAEALRFAAALADVAAFRTLRLHLLDTDVKTDEDLRLRTPGRSGPRLGAASLALPEKTRRRLIVVFTDGVGDAWHTRAAHRLLARWARGSAVAVMHALPARLWRRTGLAATRAELRNPQPAGPGSRYAGVERARGEVHIPVLEPDGDQIRPWAEFVMGTRGPWLGSAVTCSAEETAQEPGDPEAELSAEQQVQRFRMGVSPTAFQLSVLLAATPLSPALMSLVQQRMLPRSTTAHLAELLGSGLVRLADPHHARLPVVDRVPYDFRPGVREELLLAGRRSETARVLIAVADHLGTEIREIRQLRQVIISPSSAELPELSDDLTPLVKPTLTALEAMAGPYTRPAHLLKDALTNSSDSTNASGRSNDAEAGHDQSRDLSSSEDNVYQHVTKDPTAQDYFGVSVNMSAVPIARKRQSHEPTPVWNVPQKNQNFTGREDMLTLLHERLSMGTTAVLPEALHGLGGVGKSQIAIEYCYRHQDEYDLIWWIPSERLTMVRHAYVDLATHLDLDVSEPNVAVPAVKEALRLGRPYANWLLVFDNAEDAEEIQRFFPTNGPGKIMITSRSRDWFAYAAKLEVDVFQREESRQLLRRRGPEIGDQEADELSERLGDLPLAIEQAAVWLLESGMPISEYLRLFDEKRDELLRVEGPTTPVAVAWNVSFERLRQSHPAALQLLQVCAFLAPEPIPRSLLTSSRDLEGPAELLETLRDPIALSRTTRAINQYALGKMNHRDNTLSLHRLVQRVVTSQLSADETRVAKHCGHLLLANADPRNPRDRTRWPEYQALVPHVFTAKLEQCDDPWARDLFLNLIDYLFLWGDNEGFRAMAQRAWDAWTADLGSDHDATLAAELRLGRALRLFADFDAAYRHHLHARDVLKERLGPDHERTLEAEGYLGADLRYLGRFAEALEVDQRAFETLRRRFGPDDPLTLEQAHLLSIDWRLNGEPERARQLDQETYRRKEEVFGPDSLSTLSSRAALAIDEMECGRYLEARLLQELHTNEMLRKYGNSHPGAMDSIALLSVMSRKAGRHDDALKLSAEAIALFTARYGEMYQSTVAITLNHAVNLRHMGDLTKSVEVGTKARQAYGEIFGTDHPNTPTADVNVAVSLRLMGRLDEAYALDTQALAKLEELLGPDHPRTLVCAVNVASDLFELGEHEQALARDRDTLERLRRVQGPDHPTALACSLNLGLDLRALGQDAEAAALLSDTLERYRRVLDEDHPAILAAAQGKRANCDIYPIPL